MPWLTGQPPSDGLWHTYTIHLDAATFGNGSTLATVLGAVSVVHLTGEFHDSSDNGFEVLAIDNIRVSAVPEPASWALLLAGGLLLPALRNRRR